MDKLLHFQSRGPVDRAPNVVKIIFCSYLSSNQMRLD